MERRKKTILDQSLVRKVQIEMDLRQKEIAFNTRDSEYKGSEEHLIDIFDIKVCIGPFILFFF